jgi:polyhydroxybutyrate depolymerase
MRVVQSVCLPAVTRREPSARDWRRRASSFIERAFSSIATAGVGARGGARRPVAGTERIGVTWRRAAIAFLGMTAACAGGRSGSATVVTGGVQVGDTNRTFVLYAPPAAKHGGPVPLLLAFHGSGSSGAAMRREAGFDRLAARDGFLVVYPDAPAGNWAEDCGCNIADRLGVNDTGFVRVLVDSVSAWFPVDRRRVAAVGFSQGGLFVHRLACQMADLVSAVASIAAPMSGVLAERCSPSQPVSVMVMLGTLDPVFPYEGGGVGIRGTLGARASIRLWRTLGGCGKEPIVTELPDRAADGTRVMEERWTGCRNDAQIALYTVDGGRHAWDQSRDVNTADLVTAFLLRPRGPGASTARR